jgi:uncharacterized protein YndB with AHSA1/START domain
MNAQTFPNPFKTELPANEPVIIMSRTFDAPLDLVWTVWTQAEHVAYWFGPREDNQVVEYDVRPGGKWRVISSMGDGTRIVFFGTYLAVEPKTMIRNTFVVEGQFEEDSQFYEEHRFEERDGKTYSTLSKPATPSSPPAWNGAPMPAWSRWTRYWSG